MPLSPSLLRTSLIILLFGFASLLLLGGEDKDSIAVLTQPAYKKVVSFYAPLVDGSHPSDYQFTIHNPNEKQFQSWLKGNFRPLQGVFSFDAPPKNKAQMFANINSAVDSARAVIAKVQELGNFITQFDGQSLVKLPVGMQKVKADGTRFVIAINSITLYPTHAELTVYAEAKTADMEKPLILGSPDIKFTRRGGISVGSLGLIGEISAPILDSMAFFTFAGAQVTNNDFVEGVGTYAVFDCDGLREFNLDAEVVFSREVIIPVDTIVMDTIVMDTTDTQTNPNTAQDSQVRADVVLNAQDGLNDILISINIDRPFAHPSKPDVVWTVRDVVFDFSEQLHSEDVHFPVADYTPDIPSASMELWKGVHIGEVSVRLPDDFIGTDSSAINVDSITIQDVVIDHTGFTGIVKLQPVLDLNQGNMDGWGFSIDSLELHIYQNSLADFAFDGMINVPLFSDEEDGNDLQEVNSIRYGAYFDFHDDVYAFSISETEDRVLESKMLQASVTLFPTSQLDVIYSRTDGFDVSATLHGVLDVNATLGGDSDTTGLSIPSVEFQDFTIGNKGQFIRSPGSWDIEAVEVSLKAFTLVVDDVTMVSYADDPHRVDVQFIAKVNIGTRDTTSTMALSAEGGFRLKGKIDVDDTGKQNWRYDGFKMDMLHVDLNTPAVAFEGEIIFFEEIPEFGTGFQGKVSLILKKMDDVGIEAMALFGSVDDYRYFFVDVMARIPSEALTVAGLDIRGLGGGLYVNMRQEAIEQDFEETATGDILPVYDAALENNGPNEVSAYEQAILDRLGVSLSGIRYTPDPTIKLGINLGVVVATTGNEEAFNANAVLNFEFNHAGSLNQIRLAGYANAMAPISWSGPACTGVSIKFMMQYIHGNNTESGNGEFSANAHVFVNMDNVKGSTVLTPGGEDSSLPDFFTGVDCDALYYAGGIDIFLTKNDWWINIGIPNPNRDLSKPFPHFPIGLKLEAFGAIEAELSAYLDIGNNIPPFPGLPANVAELTGLGNLIAAEADRATGRGFAFGARLVTDNSIGVKGIVEARLLLDVGFDIMLQKYQDVICVNNNNQPLGFNNWYAAGQAWVYVEGSVSVLGFNVLDAALAAAIQIKGPNPLYGRGAIAGRYSVLGGLKKGSFRFPLEFGKECEIEGGGTVSLDYAIIDGVLPIDMAQNVLTDIKPTINFAYPVEKVVTPPNVEEGGPEHFVIKLMEFEFQLDGVVVPGEFVMDEDGYAGVFTPEEVLEANTTYVILATANLYESNAQGNIGTDPVLLDYDVETITFTTGDQLDYIPVANVTSAWPANGQFNYYQGEEVPNMLALASGQDELLNEVEDLFPIIRFSNQDEEFEIPFSYDADANQINFELPALTPGGAYKAELLLENSNEVEPQSLLTYYFRVSRYNTFSEKINSLTSTSLTQVGLGKHYESSFNNLLEPFGKEEIIGLDWLPATLEWEAIFTENNDDSNPNGSNSNSAWSWKRAFQTLPTDNSYVSDDTGPVIGGNFGDAFNLYSTFSGCNIGVSYLSYSHNHINRQAFGSFPSKAISINQDSIQNYFVNEENYELLYDQRTSNIQDLSNAETEIDYFVPLIIATDYREMQDEALGVLIRSTPIRGIAGMCRDDLPTQAQERLSNALGELNEDLCRGTLMRNFFTINATDFCPTYYPPEGPPSDGIPGPGQPVPDIFIKNDINSLFNLYPNCDYGMSIKYTFPNGNESNTTTNLRTL